MNETVHKHTCRLVHSFVCCKRFNLIARSHKKARIIDSSLFIYGWCNSDQFFKGINTFSSGDNTMKTSNFAGWVALAFFETKCSEPAGSYQNSPVL